MIKRRYTNMQALLPVIEQMIKEYIWLCRVLKRE